MHLCASEVGPKSMAFRFLPILLSHQPPGLHTPTPLLSVQHPPVSPKLPPEGAPSVFLQKRGRPTEYSQHPAGCGGLIKLIIVIVHLRTVFKVSVGRRSSFW